MPKLIESVQNIYDLEWQLARAGHAGAMVSDLTRNIGLDGTSRENRQRVTRLLASMPNAEKIADGRWRYVPLPSDKNRAAAILAARTLPQIYVGAFNAWLADNEAVHAAIDWATSEEAAAGANVYLKLYPDGHCVVVDAGRVGDLQDCLVIRIPPLRERDVDADGNADYAAAISVIEQDFSYKLGTL